MFLASAYPNSALSALTMMVIGLVVFAALAAWLGLVFLADRAPREQRTTVAQLGGHRPLEAPGKAANDHGDSANKQTIAERGAAA
jgi:hypothetical protein